MTRKMGLSCVLALIGFVGLSAVPAAAASGPMPIGSLTGSKNTTLDGRVPLPHTTVLSGDTLHVTDGIAMVVLNHGTRLMLGSGTAASFSRANDGVVAALSRGNILIYHALEGTGFRVKIGGVTVAPAQDCRTLGEVAMVSGLLEVTAKEGVLQVEESGKIREVSKGKTITIVTGAGRSSTPVPPGKQHISRKGRMAMAVVAGGAAATLATIELTRTSKTASSVMPSR